VFGDVVEQYWKLVLAWAYGIRQPQATATPAPATPQPRVEPAVAKAIVPPEPPPAPAPPVEPQLEAQLEPELLEPTRPPEPEPQPLQPACVDDDAAMDAEVEDEGADEGEDVIADWQIPSADEVQAARAAAEAEALSGPHKVFLSTPSGPGSLPEALKRLEEAGRVVSEFIDDGDSEPHLVYTPLPHPAVAA